MKRFQSVCLSLLLFGLAGGCNVIGAVAYKVAGEPTVPAQYALGLKKTVVLVENYRQQDMTADDASLLARCLDARLRTEIAKQDKENLTPLIAYEKVLDLRTSNRRAFTKMTIPDVGRTLGAEQVIYVDLQAGGVATMGDASIIRGSAMALVKVVDVTTGDTRWPPDISDGRAVSFETRPGDLSDKIRSDQVRYVLYDGLALGIARLFVSYKADDAR